MIDDLKAIDITREELFEKVWTTPVNAIAKAYTVHDYEIIDLCDKNNIPRPPCGYWSKFRHGYRMERPPLPITCDEKPIKVRSQLESRIVSTKQFIDKTSAKKKPNKECLPSGPQHSLVEKTYRAYRNIHPDKSDRLRSKEAALNVRIKKTQVTWRDQ